MNPLIDVHPLNTRSYAKAWLVDHVCRTKARERLTLAMAVISAIAAITAAVAATVAAVPVMQGWFGMS
jgi:hypothetical protein